MGKLEADVLLYHSLPNSLDLQSLTEDGSTLAASKPSDPPVFAFLLSLITTGDFIVFRITGQYFSPLFTESLAYAQLKTSPVSIDEDICNRLGLLSLLTKLAREEKNREGDALEAVCAHICA